MKHSKSALRSHHMRVAHMTQTHPATPLENPSPPVARRAYSTDRNHSGTNGIVVPEQLRLSIEASFTKFQLEVEDRSYRAFSPWGFL